MRVSLSLVVAVTGLACKGPTLTTSPGHVQVRNATSDVSNASDDFGQSCPGFPVAQTLTLANTGDVQVNVKSIAVTGDFALTPVPTYPLAIAPSGAATVTLTFAPSAGQAGGQAGSFTLSSDAENATVTVALTGTVASAPAQPTFGSSCTVTGGQVRTPCAFLTFGAVPVGSSATQKVTVTNAGCPPLTLAASIAQDGGDYVLGTVPGTLALAQTAEVSVTFTPSSQAAPQGKLVFATNDPDGGPGLPAGQYDVTLTGFGSAAQLTLSPPGWAAAGAAPGTSVGQTFTVTNGGGAAIALDAPEIVESDDAGAFSLDAGWPTGYVLDAGAAVSCVVTADLPGLGAFGASLVVPYGTSQLSATLTANAISTLCTDAPGGLAFSPGLLCGPPVTQRFNLFVCDGGDSAVQVSGLHVTPNPKGLYSLTLPSPDAGPWTLTPGGAALDIGVTFQDDGTLQQDGAQVVVTSTAFSQPMLNVPIQNTPAYVPPATGVPVLVDGGPLLTGSTLLFQVQAPATPSYAYQFYWVGPAGADAGLTALSGVAGADVAFTPEVATPGTNNGYKVCVDQVEVDAGQGSCGFDAGNGKGPGGNCSQLLPIPM